MNHSETNTDPGSLRVYADLQAALESGRGDDGWTSEWHDTLGSVAGLLIAKWAGCGDAIAQPRDDQPTLDHARALLAVLWKVSSQSDVPRYVQAIKLPLMTLAETRPETYSAIIAWSRGIDLGSPDGLQAAASAFDSAVRATVHRNGRHAGEYITPTRVADLMLELVMPQHTDKIYDPCFGFGELARRGGTSNGCDCRAVLKRSRAISKLQSSELRSAQLNTRSVYADCCFRACLNTAWCMTTHSMGRFRMVTLRTASTAS